MRNIVALAALAAVVSFCAAQSNPSTYGNPSATTPPPPPPAPVPYTSYYPGYPPVTPPTTTTQAPPPAYGDPIAPRPNYGYNFQGSQNQVARAIDSVLRQVSSLEARQTAAENRIDSLTMSANENIDFMNNYKNYIHDQILDEQAQQDYRLHALENRLAEIESLRGRIAELQNETEDIEVKVEDVRQWRKLFLYDINQLGDFDTTRNAMIEETRERSDHLASRVDDLIDSAIANEKKLASVQANVERVIDITNKEMATGIRFYLSPSGNSGSPSATVVYNTEFPGIGQWNLGNPFGFVANLTREQNYDYPPYQSIYFNVDTESWTNRTVFNTMDMSTGGWAANRVDIAFTVRYFDQSVLPKSLLTEIV